MGKMEQVGVLGVPDSAWRVESDISWALLIYTGKRAGKGSIFELKPRGETQSCMREKAIMGIRKRGRTSMLEKKNNKKS